MLATLSHLCMFRGVKNNTLDA